jgi:hypothetical protein
MYRRSVRLTTLVIVGLAAVIPLVLAAAGPAAATDLTYINLSGLPEGTITYGTVTDSAGTMTWTLNGFTFGGITYTPVGVDGVCWDNTSAGSNHCDGFGSFVQGTAINGTFINPETNSDNGDSSGEFAAHVKWTSSNGGACTGFIGSFSGDNGVFATSGNSTNDCAAAVVPEPGSILLMATGLPGLAGLVVMRKRQIFGPKA